MTSCGGHNYAYLQSIERGGASSWNVSFNAQYRPQLEHSMIMLSVFFQRKSYLVAERAVLSS